MSLFIASLNSGSNGNCYYIGNETEAILVDAGISCKETEMRMSRLNLSIKNIKGIFVSHEHTDHIAGIPMLARKHQLPIYITAGTRKNSKMRIDKHLVFSFEAYKPIVIGGLMITAFPKFHDACDPHSFIVTSSSVRVGIFTDIGYACDDVIRNFKECHAAFLEANYDTDMLSKGSYPYFLKKRITSGRGHLSNVQALELLLQHRPAYMSHLLLSHLSKNNNCPKLVEALFNQHADNTKIVVASRYEETPVYHITSTIGNLARKQQATQMQLF